MNDVRLKELFNMSKKQLLSSALAAAALTFGAATTATAAEPDAPIEE